MKASPIQNNFIGGEFSPLTLARIDSDLYPTGLAKCFNYIPLVQGPVTRRPGTYYVANGKNSGAFRTVRLQAFQFSNVQAYMLEFGDQYIRFFRNNGPVETSPGVPYEVASDYYFDDVMDLQFVQSADVLYIFHPKYKPKMLTRTAHTSWTLTNFPDSDGPYMAQNVGATTLTPSATTGNINITASVATFDTTLGGANEIGRCIRMKHSSTWGYAIVTGVTSSTVVTARVVNAFGGTTAVTIWRLGLWCGVNGYPGTATFHEDRLFLSGNTKFPQRVDGSVTGDYTNFQPSATDGTVTSAHALSFTLNSSDVNVVKWITSDEKGLLVGTSSSEWTIRPASSLEALSATNVVAKKGSSYGAIGVQAVQVGRSSLFIQKTGKKVRDFRYYYDVDGFRSADLTLLSEHITGEGLTQIALQKDPQQIIWAAREDGALIGFAYEREFETIKVGWHRHVLGGYGDKAKGQAKVKSVAVIPSADGLSDELWLAVERWNGTTWVVNIEYMTSYHTYEDDFKNAFFVDCGLTYDNPLLIESVVGVSLGTETGIVIIAHGLSNGDRVILDSIPGTEELNGRVYVVSDALADSFKLKDLEGNYIDSSDYTAYAYDGTNPGYARKLVTTVSGLSHLEGQEVMVVADGVAVSGKTVSSGAITLDSPAAIIHVGFGYTSDLQLLRAEAGSTDGTSMGKTRRTHRLGMNLLNINGLQIGASFEKLNNVIFKKTTDAADKATPLFSGITSHTFEATYDFDNQICFRQELPYPGTILAIMPQLVTQDRG